MKSLQKIAGWALVAAALVWTAGAFLWGKHFYIFQKIEVNFRDPVFVLIRALGLAALGLVLLGKTEPFKRLFRFLGTRRGLWIFTAFGFLLFTSLALLKYYTGNSCFGDMALFETYFHKLASGKEPWVFMNARPKLLWSDHTYFLFPFLAVLYKLFGMAGIFVFTKALFAGSAPLAFWLGKELSAEKRGVLVALSTLAPGYLSFYLGDLYVEPLVFPLGIGALAAFERRRWWLLALFSVGFVFLREDAPLALAGLGIYFALRSKNWRWLLFSAAAVGASFGLMAWQRTLAGPNFAAERLAARYGLESLLDPGGLARAFIRSFRPLSLLGFLIAALGFGGLALASWRGALAGFFSALPHMASRYYRQAQLRGYFGTFAYPALFAGVFETLRRLEPRRAVSWGAVALGFAGLFGPRCFLRSFSLTPWREATEAVRLIPENAAVAVSPSLAPAVAPRDTIYLYPWAGAEFVLLDTQEPLYELYRISPEDVISALEEAGYRPVFKGSRVWLFRWRRGQGQRQREIGRQGIPLSPGALGVPTG